MEPDAFSSLGRRGWAALVPVMEDEARWMIRNRLTDKQAVPDFLDYMYLDDLKASKPGAVSIIR